MAVVSENGDFCRYTDSSEKGHIWFHHLRNVQMVLENAISTNIILSLLGLVLFKFVESLPLRDFQTVLKSSSKLTKYHFQSFLLFTGTQTVVTFLNVHSKIVSSHARIEKTIEEQSVFLGSHVSEESKCGSFFFFFLQNVCHMTSCKVLCHHRAEHQI